MQTQRLAIITDEEHPGLRPDDVPMASAFKGVGVEAVPVPWGRGIDAEAFDAALVRTPWDYFDEPSRFLSWIDGLGVPVLNDAATLRWNHDKRYLIQLEEAGAGLLPATRLLEAGTEADTAQLLRELGCDRAVVKPVVSGGAFGTRVVSEQAPLAWEPGERGGYLIQAFVDAVTAIGEWSLIYFGGRFSHSVLKVPKAGDFRVQDDFGGAVRFDSAPGACMEAAERVLGGALDLLDSKEPLVYARVDLVENGEREPILMELELIEPELFLRADAESPGRLAAAVRDRLGWA